MAGRTQWWIVMPCLGWWRSSIHECGDAHTLPIRTLHALSTLVPSTPTLLSSYYSLRHPLSLTQAGWFGEATCGLLGEGEDG
jgi:hypothetical protein